MFEDGERSGFGKMITPGGDYIECHWKNGRPHGDGYIVKKLNGKVKAKWSNGSLLKVGA